MLVQTKYLSESSKFNHRLHLLFSSYMLRISHFKEYSTRKNNK